MFRESVVLNVQKKSSNKVIENVCYFVISLTFGLLSIVFSMLLKIAGFTYTGLDWNAFLIEWFMVFTAVFFIGFKKKQRELKRKND